VAHIGKSRQGRSLNRATFERWQTTFRGPYPPDQVDRQMARAGFSSQKMNCLRAFQKILVCRRAGAS
jgi:hypothetical protein